MLKMKFPGLLTPCFCHAEKNDQNLLTETGFDRLRRIFQKNEYDLMSPELHYFLNYTSSTVLVTSFLGAFIHANKARDDYMRRNVASTYESDFKARRHLTDTMSMSAFKGGLSYGLKYGSFSSMYMLITMCAANYNNKITIWEHIGAGAFLGGMFRINYGLKGMAVAGGLGGFLGAFAGGIFVLFLRYNNATLDDIRSWQSESYFASRRERSQKIRERGGGGDAMA